MVANTIEAIQTSKLNPVNPTEPGTLLLSSRLPHNQIMFEHGVMFWTKGTGTDKNGKPVTAVIPDSTDLERDPNAKPQIRNIAAVSASVDICGVW